MESKNSSTVIPIKITGYLRMSDKQRRKNNKGQELFHFIPLSTHNLLLLDPNYQQLNVQIFVTSDAVSKRKSASNTFLYDLYVNIIIITDTIKTNSSNNNIWYGRIDEIIGECNDLSYCSLALAFNRNLFKDNKTFIRKPTNSMISIPPSLPYNNNTTNNMEINAIFKLPETSETSSIHNNRYDLRNNNQYTIFSIDPLNCIDIDDAIHIRMLSPQESFKINSNTTSCSTTGCNVRNIDPTHTSTTTKEVEGLLPDYEIGIHISDVTNYIKATESDTTDNRLFRIVQEAFHRSFTVYLSNNKQTPILPPYLSHEYCSLQANQDRYAISCILTITPYCSSTEHQRDTTTYDNNNNNNNTISMDYLNNKYKIKSCKFQKSLITNVGAYNYDEIDDFLFHKPTTIAITSSGNSRSIEGNKTSILRSVKISLKHLQQVFDDTVSSHKIIEILMIQANYQVAKLINHSNHILSACLLRRQQPLLILKQEVPLEEEELIVDSKDKDIDLIPASQLLKQIPIDLNVQAAEYIYCNINNNTNILTTMNSNENSENINDKQYYYTDEEKRHYSLNIPLYTHFTSPIRRFVDQVVHVLVNKCIDEQQHQQSKLSNKDNIYTRTDHQLSSCCESSSSSSCSSDNNNNNIDISALKLTNTSHINNQLSCPWLSLFTVDNIKYINEMRRLHIKYQRDVTILNFVFNQCELAKANEVTISAKAIVLPFRHSNKYSQYKTDLYVIISSDCQFIYPLRIHTSAQKHLVKFLYNVKKSQVSIHSCIAQQQSQQVQEVVLTVGQEIPVLIHCMKSSSNFKKKCVLSSTYINVFASI